LFPSARLPLGASGGFSGRKPFPAPAGFFLEEAPGTLHSLRGSQLRAA
jgi:hypothetical protein